MENGPCHGLPIPITAVNKCFFCNQLAFQHKSPAGQLQHTVKSTIVKFVHINTTDKRCFRVIPDYVKGPSQPNNIIIIGGGTGGGGGLKYLYGIPSKTAEFATIF